MLSVGSSLNICFLSASASPIFAVVDDLPDSLLTFSPIRVILLVIWVYLCLYSIQRIEYGSLVRQSLKPYINLPALFIGPIILLVLITADTVGKVQRGELSIEDIFSHLWNTRKKVIVSKKRTIHLLDSAGRSFDEVYGQQGDSKGVDREVLDMAEDMILDALEDGASDILVDPKDDGYYTIRFRVDGMLRLAAEMELSKAVAVINSIKAISGMDIAEKRRPQDGAFMAKIPEGKAYFRIASAGVLGGEKISIRILDQSAGLMKLEDVGLTQETFNQIAKAVQQPSGMILVCGPTGSGKTTSLYAMLGTIDFFTRNVITVEDPVEHYLPQASQIEVNVKADITFANALRSILRQDPDVICVGEIRDSETANMALQASQTGHLVLATLHSSSHMAAMGRLMGLGLNPLLMSSALSIIVSQRLVRKLCDKCKAPAAVSKRHAESFRKRGVDPSKVMKSCGCRHCDNTGYRGRLAIMDVMRVDSKLKARLVDGNVSIADIKQHGDKNAKSTLRDQGLRKVAAGLTTLDEVKRVTSNMG